MTLYDIVAAGPILVLNRESGILASYADGRVLVYEYAGMERAEAGSFDKAGLVPTYQLIDTQPWAGDCDEDLTQLKDYAKICVEGHS